MKKIVLLANTGWFIYNFRIALLNDIYNSNYDVVVIAPNDKYTEKLKVLGYKVCDWKLNRSSLNPILELFSILDLIKKINQEKPDLIHNFTIKACLYGTIASKFTNVKYVINSITGLGHLFINNSVLIRIVRFFLKPIYSFIFNSSGSKMIFENFEDQEFFIKIGIIKNSKNTFLIEGSGVDSEFFKPSENVKFESSGPIKLLFPSRLILEKGIEEVLVAHNQLLKKGENIQLYIAGEIDYGNRSSINKKFRQKINQNKNIFLLGHRSDMREVFSKSDIVVLPSWREGLSKSLIEAGSMEKPIVTTDTPGCRNIIDHGVNGLLVPIKDPKAIELAILFFIKNKIAAKNFGKNLRCKVQKKFDVKIINNQTIALYKKILN
tara:strand:- start:130 stop:1266 length:1137 start_codon:yes stop_codon:yes gene_type:complete